MPSVRETILDQVRAVAERQNKTLAPLTDDLPLLQSGLDSLCIAMLVADLEDQTGIDPFTAGDDVEVPTTLGDFIMVYERASQ